MIYWQSVFILLILSLSPALLWLYFYYRKDYIQPEPKKLIVKTFLYGMLAALPLLVVQYVNRFYPDWSVLNLVQRSISNYLLGSILFYMIVAYVEEYLKHIGMVALVEKHRSEFDQIVDGIMYAVASALGFVFVENLLYFWAAQAVFGLSAHLLLIFSVRAIVSTLAHTVFSGYFGYFYAKAKLDHHITSSNKTKLTHFNRDLLSGAWKLHVFRSHLSVNRPSQSKHEPRLLVAEGFFLAFILHFIYNMLVSVNFGTYNFAYLVVPLLFLAAYYLFSQFYCEHNHIIVKRKPGKLLDILCWPEKRKFIKEYGHSEEEWRELFVRK
ncbi:MAG: PrsW family intramembrane metalloprotease [Candidatus Gracilibacteria bacterium]|nr:PrsW family intramembrane metalloprotease [Candidatus Gracilibacteria bacterium]